MRLALASLLLLGIAGCAPSTFDVNPADVLALSICPDRPCTPPADGRTPVPVRVCTPQSNDRASPFDVTLRVSAGAWQDTSPASPTTHVSLAAEQCADAAFVPDLMPRPVVVTASFQGFTVSDSVPLTSARLRRIDVVTDPPAISASAPATVAVTATVTASDGGPPSANTVVAFSVAGTGALGVTPRSASPDANGTAHATLSAAAGAGSITLSVLAAALDDPTNLVSVDVLIPVGP
jgi:hypothetical protein